MSTTIETPSILIFLLGFLVSSSFYDDSEMIQLLKWLVNLFAIMYTVFVFILFAILYCYHLHSSITRRNKLTEESYDSSLNIYKQPLVSTKTEKKGIPELVRIDTTRSDQNQTSLEISLVDGDDEKKSEDDLPLIDLNGSFRLEKNINFPNFLAAQGVSWALRAAANKAITTQHITHEGSMLKIKVSGIITSETVYTIDGPAIQTKIKDRVYLDYVSYLDNGQGIKVLKINKDHNYNIAVVRTLLPNNRILIITSTATFSDGKAVQAIQHYRRLESSEK